MCTVLLSFDPDAAWPILVAFVRDEDRARETAAPAFWWSSQPTALGGRDERASGTWLAVDIAQPSLALLTAQYDPAATLPNPARSPTRGALPLLALARGTDFDLEADAPSGVDSYQPFHLLSIHRDADGWQLERWGWDGSELDHQQLGPGTHVVASRVITLPGEGPRRAAIHRQISAAPAPVPEPNLTPTEAWGEWIDLLDGRATEPDQLDALTVHSVGQRPGFGTVGATLVALADDDRVRYDVNDTPSLAPDAWTPVTAAASSPEVAPRS